MRFIKPSQFSVLLGLFIIVNLVVVAVKPIFVDPAMYWFYGQHPAWLYFDAPPLVAWVTAGATTLFGTHAWVINALGLGFVLASARYLYLLAYSAYDKKIAEWITLAWLFTPAIGHIYIRFNWGYNNLLLFFWIATLYYFYQTQKTLHPKYFYSTAIVIALAILSHFEAAFLILTLLLVLIAVPNYRKLWGRKHLYGAFLLILILITPYLWALIKSDWQPLRVQFQFHANGEGQFLNPTGILDFFNDIINELNFFFILGCILVAKNYRLIYKDTNNPYFLWCTLVIFVPFLLLSLHTTFPMKYYMPFYYGFLLLSLPLMTEYSRKYFTWILWFNIALFVLDSWNVIMPRFGVSTGGNIFYQQNLQKIAVELRPMIRSQDLLVGCARDANNVSNQNDYSDFVVLAFYLNHKNTYTTQPGFFIWQKPIKEVFVTHSGATVYYLCENNPPPQLQELTCEPTQTISASSYKLNQSVENHWYWQRCKIS